jgi:ribosomal protein S18 acetylase RimI-like enzyme
MNIRKASLEDAGVLCELGRACFIEAFAHLNDPKDFEKYLKQAFTLSQFEAEVSTEGSVFFLASIGGKPVGYAKLRQATEQGLEGLKAIELQRLYVLKDFYGQQVGRALLDHCLQEATGQQYQVMWLGVWEKNSRAIRFYEKCGFVVFGIHPFAIGKDIQTDYLMKKNLG